MQGIQRSKRHEKKLHMIQPMFKFMVALAIAASVLAGCDNRMGLVSKAVEKEVTGTEEQRVTKVEEYLLRNVATVWHAETNGNTTIWTRFAQKPGVTLPGKIADPHFLYVSADSFRNDGDQYYVSFRVPVKDVDKWAAILEPTKPPQRYNGDLVLPKQPRAWWVTDEHLLRLTFYDPRTLAGLGDGWVGVDRATGKIFVYSFTM
jgi:hypothetical protein